MRSACVRLAGAVLALVAAASAAAGERCIALDGDTLVCNRQKVRLTNVYAAELNEKGGRAARQRLRTLVASGEVTLRPLGTDRYGRTLAEVYVNGRRIEQSDIGPRAGRGAEWHGERHFAPWHSRPRKVPSSARRVVKSRQPARRQRSLNMFSNASGGFSCGS